MLSEKNLPVEPLKVIISSRGEECDSKVHITLEKLTKGEKEALVKVFSCNCHRMKQWNAPCSVKWGMGKGTKLTNVLKHSPVAEGKYKGIKYNEE